jgi:hypothetical protein
MAPRRRLRAAVPRSNARSRRTARRLFIPERKAVLGRVALSYRVSLLADEVVRARSWHLERGRMREIDGKSLVDVRRRDVLDGDRQSASSLSACLWAAPIGSPALQATFARHTHPRRLAGPAFSFCASSSRATSPLSAPRVAASLLFDGAGTIPRQRRHTMKRRYLVGRFRLCRLARLRQGWHRTPRREVR